MFFYDNLRKYIYVVDKTPGGCYTAYTPNAPLLLLQNACPYTRIQ